jgi:hypothetical protein
MTADDPTSALADEPGHSPPLLDGAGTAMRIPSLLDLGHSFRGGTRTPAAALPDLCIRSPRRPR